MPTPTGTYAQVDGRPVVRFERTFPHPVDAVWSAVTTPAELQKWFPTTVEFSRLASGEAIAFRFADDAYPAMAGEIREVDAPRRFAFTWGDDVLTFELLDADAGTCRLSFTVVLDDAGKAARDGAGWDDCLDMLRQVVDRRTPERPYLNGNWHDYYEQYKARGFLATAEIPQPS